MRQRLCLFSAIVLSSLAYAAPAPGQTQPDEIFVSASRIEQPLRQIGSAVDLFTVEEIEQSQASFVLDFLSRVPGLSTAQSGPAGAQGSVFLRGAENFNTLVLIDGIEVSDPSTPQTLFNFGPLMTGDIGRIEILRGPQSTLYGGDAIGGVIAITTRRAREGTDARARFEAGSNNTQSMAGNIATSDGVVDLSGNVTLFRTDGVSAADEARGNREDDGTDNATLSATMGADISEHLRLEVAARHMFADTDIDNSFTTPVADNFDSVEQTDTAFRGAAIVSLLDGRSETTLSAQQSDVTRQTFNAFGGFEFNGRRNKAEILSSLDVTAGHTLIAGLAYEQEDARSSFGLAEDIAMRSGFGEWVGGFDDRLFATLGGRVDSHTRFGTHWTGRATAALVLDDWLGRWQGRLRGVAATGFRAPSISELFDPFSGNPDLTEEQARSFEAGFDLTSPGGSLDAAITFFASEVDDLIQFDFATFTYVQTGTAQSRGVEARIGWRALEHLRLDGSYTFNDTEGPDGRDLSRRPRHAVSLIATWTPRPDIIATLDATWQDDTFDRPGNTALRLNDFFTLGTAAEWQMTENLSLHGRITNLTDEDYETAFGFGTPGIQAFAGLTIRH